jgi:hypothetical protein
VKRPDRRKPGPRNSMTPGVLATMFQCLAPRTRKAITSKGTRISALIWLFVAACVGLFSSPLLAQARTPVAIELAIAVDVSLSVDDVEFDLQMTGIANAFRTAEIIGLIRQHDGVAVTLFQWSSQVDPQYEVPWQLLHSAESVLSFADKIERTARDPVRGFTAMGRAIEFALVQIASNGFDGRRLKIDISGDGRSNSGIIPTEAWPLAEVQGAVINGLPILIDTYNMDIYFREKVIFGPGAFIEIATDYADFADAFFRKLRREFAPLTSQNGVKPAASARQAQLGTQRDGLNLQASSARRRPDGPAAAAAR